MYHWFLVLNILLLIAFTTALKNVDLFFLYNVSDKKAVRF